MKRNFILRSTYGQEVVLDLTITVSQGKAIPAKTSRRDNLAAIIRANWAVIEEVMQAYICPGYSREALWDGEERIGIVEDVETGANLTFTATEDGPRFTHEIVSAGSPPYQRR
jgi:hypothetical protein